MERVRFELDCIRVRPGLGLRVSLDIQTGDPLRTADKLQRDYPANWTPAEAAADLLAIYRDTPYTATRGE